MSATRIDSESGCVLCLAHYPSTKGNIFKMQSTDSRSSSASQGLSSYLPFPTSDLAEIGTENQIGDAAHVITLLVAHERGIFRDSLVALLRTTPGLTVVGEISDDRRILDAVRQLHPDVILLDLAIPQDGGLA